MIAYHSITTDSLQTALKEGLKRTSRGEKGNDSAIAKTDAYLDAHRPAHLVKKDVSRDDNLYAYVADGDCVIDITDGKKVRLREFIHQEDQTALQITIDPTRCYVSDIDLFDRVKAAIESGADEQTLLAHAARYWQNIRPANTFTIGDIRRPEIMIPYNIPPNNMKQLE